MDWAAEKYGKTEWQTKKINEQFAVPALTLLWGRET
jgi:hypothetical protein